MGRDALDRKSAELALQLDGLLDSCLARLHLVRICLFPSIPLRLRFPQESGCWLAGLVHPIGVTSYNATLTNVLVKVRAGKDEIPGH